MKRVLVFLLLILSPQLYGQDFVKDYINDMGDKKEDVFIVSISGKMLRIASAMSKEADKDFKELVKNIDKINMIGDLELDDEEKEHLKKLFGKYEELMSITDEGQEVNMYLREKDGKIKEFIIYIEEDHDCVTLINILQDIDLEQLSKLSSGLNIKGMEYLNKIENQKNEVVQEK